MGEEILAAVIRRDESEAFRVVEPLHGPCRHVISILELLQLRKAVRASQRAMFEGRN
jgi:hypothetical protein